LLPFFFAIFKGEACLLHVQQLRLHLLEFCDKIFEGRGIGKEYAGKEQMRLTPLMLFAVKLLVIVMQTAEEAAMFKAVLRVLKLSMSNW
jgi:hypothetical protein